MTEFIVAVPSQIVSIGMQTLINQDPHFKVAAVVTNQHQLRDAISQSPYATVILGSQLCGDGTIEIWRRIQRRFADVQVLLWAVRFQDVLDFQCNLDRVEGYLLASAQQSEFLQACQTLSRGRIYVAASVAEYLARNPARQRQSEVLSKLSKREIQVAQMIAQGRRVAVIARLLNISSKTVNTFRYRIFDKLELSGDVELTHLALQTGLVDLDVEVIVEEDDAAEGDL
ncbi:response regulator transcription factor [Pseudidiomarina insulisalsae]|uniref:Helix-turn-helix transcriptional regulator n=1 Tax=Pseudidiomarina insulisalsae TaxID=575789 RepID=A0A432YH59_9GAMM|nr:response regulator transcription factor [Pseudidiomarina insulisalsae]RUO60274.1 helix-turn-helix transcriptional regulator [Pseudidiomarina insulisalsae]